MTILLATAVLAVIHGAPIASAQEVLSREEATGRVVDAAEDALGVVGTSGREAIGRLREVVQRHGDVDHIVSASVPQGLWASWAPDQRGRYAEAYIGYLSRNYALALGAQDEPTIDLMRMDATAEGDWLAIVNLRARHDGQELSIPLTIVVSASGLTDVLIEGQSTLKAQRDVMRRTWDATGSFEAFLGAVDAAGR